MARQSKRNRDAKRFGSSGLMVDDMAAGGIVAPAGYVRSAELAGVDGGKAIASLVRRAMVIRADNVHDYIDSNPRMHDDVASHVPTWAPPAPVCFVEYGRRMNGSAGMLCFAYGKFGDVPGSLVPSRTRARMEQYGASSALMMKLFARPRSRGVFGPMALVEHLLADDGRLIPGGVFKIDIVTYEDMPDRVERERVLDRLVSSASIVSGMAFSLMQCKNVSTRVTEPPAEFARERKKAGKPPLSRHHTIVIDPIGKSPSRPGRPGAAPEAGRSFHICRGHFSEYSEERPLFGRPGLHGRFWVPMHTRGSEALGLVTKDYSIANIGGGRA